MKTRTCSRLSGLFALRSFLCLPGACRFLLAAFCCGPAAYALDFTYTAKTDALTIAKYTGPGGDVIIPDTVDGLPVTTIGSSAFWNCRKLTSLTLPDTVTTINNGAFSFCTSLARVRLPTALTSIGNSAFQNCASLTNVTLPDTVTNLESFVFAGCASLPISQSPTVSRVSAAGRFQAAPVWPASRFPTV